MELDHLHPSIGFQQSMKISDVRRPSFKVDPICQQPAIDEVERLWYQAILATIFSERSVQVPSLLGKGFDTALFVILVVVIIIIVDFVVTDTSEDIDAGNLRITGQGWSDRVCSMESASQSTCPGAYPARRSWAAAARDNIGFKSGIATMKVTQTTRPHAQRAAMCLSASFALEEVPSRSLEVIVSFLSLVSH